MRVFEYSFLNNGLLPASLINLAANIASLKTMAGVRKDEYSQVNNYKAYYYEALWQSSEGWAQNENSYFPYLAVRFLV